MEVDSMDIVTAVADAVASAVKSGPPPPPLPTGWILKQSRSQPGYYYYFNMETGARSWIPPAEALQGQPVDVGSDQQQHLADDHPMDRINLPPPPPVPSSSSSQQQHGQEEHQQQDQHQQDHIMDYNSIDNTGSIDGSSIVIKQEEDPETAPDRSSKRRKGTSSSSSNTTSGADDASASSSSSPKEVRVLHILKKHRGSRRPSSWRQPKITQSLEEAKEELVGMLEILQDEASNPDELRATFEELARTESDCSSAKRGGDLGFFGRRKMQPAFEAASFGLQIGEYTKEIVETSSGAHLILRIG